MTKMNRKQKILTLTANKDKNFRNCQTLFHINQIDRTKKKKQTNRKCRYKRLLITRHIFSMFNIIKMRKMKKKKYIHIFKVYKCFVIKTSLCLLSVFSFFNVFQFFHQPKQNEKKTRWDKHINDKLTQVITWQRQDNSFSFACVLFHISPRLFSLFLSSFFE